MTIPLPVAIRALAASASTVLVAAGAHGQEAAQGGLRWNVRPDPAGVMPPAALPLLAVIAVTVGAVGAIGYLIWRSFRRPGPEAELIEEVSRAGDPPAPETVAGPEWERPADWWKEPSAAVPPDR